MSLSRLAPEVVRSSPGGRRGPLTDDHLLDRGMPILIGPTMLVVARR